VQCSEVHSNLPTPPRPGLHEALAVWALLGVVAVATFITYTRLDPDVLYNTTREGVAGGASRTLVYLNYPVALIAIAMLALAGDRLAGRSRAIPWLAGAAAVLCAAVAVPGVVDPGDLDARPVNVLPALGVAVAVVLTVLAARSGVGTIGRRVPGDRIRFAAGTVLVIAAVPWAFAEVGFYAPPPFVAEEVFPGETIAAVHLGRHHGMDGVFFALTALALSRVLGGFRNARLAAATSAYLALMLAYGTALAAEDFWLEQVVKPGHAAIRIPDVLRPSLSLGWLAIVLGAVVVEVLWFRRIRRRGPARGPG
jgi:hypothetical protein